MIKNLNISVRAIENSDINFIADYWENAQPDFLHGMGVDLNKLPARKDLCEMIARQIALPFPEKKSFAVIWELDDIPVGYSNVNPIDYGNQATMHLHMCKSDNRKKGLGSEFVKKSIPVYFEKLKINKLVCEPYSLNPAPNRTLNKVGFELVKTYRTVPGSLNFEQEVNRWEMTIEKFNNRHI